MSSQGVSAITTASVSGVTLIGTAVTQIIGFRSTISDTKWQIQAIHQDTAGTFEQQPVQNEETREQQREQVNTRLAEQRHHLDTTPQAQSELKQTLEQQPRRRFRGLHCQSLTPCLPASASETL